MSDQIKPDLCAWCGCTVDPKAFNSRLMVLSGSLTRIAACSVVHMALWDKKASEDRERLLAACQAMQKWILRLTITNGSENACLKIAHAAIAKAKGEEVIRG